MPITKSAQKALRQNIRRRALNDRYKQKFKALIKEYRKAIKIEADNAKNMLPAIYKALDKAAKHGVIKRNTVDRYKSRLTKILQKTA